MTPPSPHKIRHYWVASPFIRKSYTSQLTLYCMAAAFPVLAALALTHGRIPNLLAPREFRIRPRCSMSLSDDLNKAEATLKGLLQDGFGPEALSWRARSTCSVSV